MAVLALIGVETGNTAEFDSASGSATNSVVRSGNYAYTQALAGNAVKTLASSVSSGTVWFRFGFRIDDDTFTNNAADFLDIRTSGASNVVTLQLNTSERIILTAGGSNGTSTTALATNTWYLIEIRHQISTGSNGETQLYINGNSEVLLTNLTTTQTIVDFDFNTSSTGPANHYYDDILVTTDGRPNDGAIVALVPNADDSTRDAWEDQAAGATTWDKVDEIPFSTTDYAISKTSGAGAQEQEWDLTTQASAGTINGAKLIVNARDTGGGGSTEVEIPTSVLSSTNLTGGVTDIDDDPDSPDGLWMAVDTTGGSNNKATDVRVDFATPSSGTLDATANAQNFKAYVRKTNHSTNPTARIELWENGSLVRAGGETTVTSTTGQLLPTFTWSVSELATSDGSNVECKVVGTPGGGNPGNRASVGVGAVEWNAAISSTTTHKLVSNNVNASSRVLTADLGLTTSDAWYETILSGTNVPGSQAALDAYRIGGEASASGDPRMRINAAYLMIDFTAGGATTLTPDPAVTAVVAPSPTIALGNLSITPDAAVSPVIAPAVVLVLTNTLTPDPAATALAAPDVTVALGALTLTPDAAASPVVAPSVTVALGALTITPDPAATPVVAPSVTLDFSKQLTPTPAGTQVLAPSVTLLLGGVTKTPDAAVTALAAPSVTVALGGITRTPDPAVSPVVAPAVTVALGALTLTPDPAATPVVAPNVTLDTGALPITLTPDPAVSAVVAPTPVVVYTVNPNPAGTALAAPDVTLAFGVKTLTPDPAVTQLVVPLVAVLGIAGFSDPNDFVPPEWWKQPWYDAEGNPDPDNDKWRKVG